MLTLWYLPVKQLYISLKGSILTPQACNFTFISSCSRQSNTFNRSVSNTASKEFLNFSLITTNPFSGWKPFRNPFWYLEKRLVRIVCEVYIQRFSVDWLGHWQLVSCCCKPFLYVKVTSANFRIDGKADKFIDNSQSLMRNEKRNYLLLLWVFLIHEMLSWCSVFLIHFLHHLVL